jgi:hypothetical protein
MLIEKIRESFEKFIENQYKKKREWRIYQSWYDFTTY